MDATAEGDAPAAPSAANGDANLIAASHYRVCRKMVAPPEDYLPLVPPVAPPERVYQPLTLKTAAATVCTTHG